MEFFEQIILVRNLNRDEKQDNKKLFSGLDF